MSPLQLTLLKYALMGLVGVPMALLLDPSHRWFYLVGGMSYEYVPMAYYWSVYGFVIMAGCFFVLGLHRHVVQYQIRALVPAPRKQLQQVWLGLMLATMLAILLLLAQNGFVHPALAIVGKNAQEIAIARIETARAINMSVYNLAVHVFMAFALTIAVVFLRSAWMTVITAIVFLVLVTFSLAKSPIADTLVELGFVYLLVNRRSWRALPLVGICVVAALAAMYVFTGRTTSVIGFVAEAVVRIIWAASDLPHYFARFAHERVGFLALLPPYVQDLVGNHPTSAARLVMEFSNPGAVREGSAGVSNTLFIGEAYAFAGLAGALLSPFVVGAAFAVVIFFFSRLPKTAYNLFAFGYLLDRLTAALMGGIGGFVFSAIHVILGSLAFVVFVRLSLPPPRIMPDGQLAAASLPSQIRGATS